jgi:ABC-type nickel/cobalt efflux system permease component RcnA
VNLRSRLATVVGLTACLFGALGLAGTPVASAHPLGNFTVNRYSGLDLSPGSVRILYVVDMAEIPTYQETTNIDTDADGTVTDAEKQAWADRAAPPLLEHVALNADGARVALSLMGDHMRFRPGQAGLPILRLEATFVGTLPASAGVVEYRDDNYGGRIGWKEVTVRSMAGVSIAGSSVPSSSVSDTLLAYPVDMLSNPLDVVTATFSFHPGAGTTSPVSATGGGTVSGAPVASGGSFAGLVRWRLSPLVLALSLLLAFGFGAVHALGPGHGKTITAAYLVGAGAKRRQAVGIGIAVSLMHTASVLMLGLIFLFLARSLPPERIYPWLELVTGLVAIGLGAYLVVSRVRARHSSLHPWHGHAHPWDEDGTGHTHDHPGAGPVTRRSLLALAMAGGILPSPTAFVVLLGAIRAHRIGYGLGLIVAFSAGLAAALVLVGLFAIRARSVVATRLAGRWMSLLPIASAAVILGFGIFFLTRGTARII